MSDAETTEQFIAALGALERERDFEAMSGLFAPNSDIGNNVSSRDFAGAGGARAFWETYRSTFGDMESSFRNVIVGDGRAALEWSTTGTTPGGDPIEYTGVSILEMESGQITRFRAYFDPSDLGHQFTREGASKDRFPNP